MRQPQLPAYAQQYLPTELRLMQTGGYVAAHPRLTAEEKALIYHYTASGSTNINRQLRTNQGVPTNALDRELVAAVRKMPVYQGSAYSAAHLSLAELSRLRSVFTGGRRRRQKALHGPLFYQPAVR